MAAGDRVSGLIDPACYHGDAEVDLAMLGLFDQPVAAFYDAYGLLEPGHDERTAIYRLWPALVHMRLIGAGYRPMVERLLQKQPGRDQANSTSPLNTMRDLHLLCNALVPA